ncbi:sialidase family protein [Arsenicibacter rosenii]|uniref:sialidase family protein n=1 Tax=Arsenicibacter rosenii TaxID=1750698 RepID=UPI0009F42F17|nr:sialidase family protein [Arsenicibacter rosenii]
MKFVIVKLIRKPAALSHSQDFTSFQLLTVIYLAWQSLNKDIVLFNSKYFGEPECFSIKHILKVISLRSVLHRFILIVSVNLCSCKTQDKSLISTSINPVGKESDAALVAPVIDTKPLPTYDYDQLDFSMNNGIARTPKGRIWSCWVAGGDDDNAFFVLNYSNDNGESWSKPSVVIDPHDTSLEDKRRSVVGNLWTDPQGHLWLLFDQSLTYYDGRSGTWYTRCDNPDSDTPIWSKPVRIWHGCSLNKPNVFSNNTWLVTISLWNRGLITLKYKQQFRELDAFRMANVIVSSDQGKTWIRQGGVLFPGSEYDEHHIIERRDGTLWMTARTINGIWESVSSDKGITWSKPVKYQEHVNSRHFIRRLQSGRILLVRHGAINELTSLRTKLTAYLSEDDGKSWIGGLLLDDRSVVSYPDGFQSSDGTIYISYDRNRNRDAEILLARFTEEDILLKKFAGQNSKARILISKALKNK